MTPIPTYHLGNPLQHGPGVKELQMALKKDKFYNGPIDGIFGIGTAGACKRAKYRLGYPTAAVVPTGGAVLLSYLTGEEHLPATFVLRRHERGYGISKEQWVRAAIVANALWGVSHEPSIHYTMDNRRDDALRGPERHLPLWTDCSGFDTLCYKWAGAPDPNGLKYRALGFTGTMLDHLKTIPLHDAEIGDLVIWGIYPGHHVAMIVNMSNPKDPDLVSHGQERGPFHISLSAETAAQKRGYVVKRGLGV